MRWIGESESAVKEELSVVGSSSISLRLSRERERETLRHRHHPWIRETLRPIAARTSLHESRRGRSIRATDES